MRHDETARQDRIGTEDLIDPGHTGAQETDSRHAAGSGLGQDTPGRDTLAADRAENTSTVAPTPDGGRTGTPDARANDPRTGADDLGATDGIRGDRDTVTAGTDPAEHDDSPVDGRNSLSDKVSDQDSSKGSSHRQAAPGERDEEHAALFEDRDSDRFRSRWHDVQAAFVDDPQRAVQDADQLVAELMQTLASTFAERKQSLEGQWQKGGDAETEDLRLALRSYRSFFDQLLPH